jgi:Arc/MetJ family transcription regulator
MRTNIVLDDELIETAMKVSGHKTKKATVEEGLRLLILVKRQAEIKKWRGKIPWKGDLKELRSND